MNLKLKDPKQLVALFSGFIFLSLGIYLTKQSLLGMSSWSVFHDGLAQQVSFLSFGVVTQIVGLIILTISITFLRTKIGYGTLLNILLVGPLVDLFDYLYQFGDAPFYLKSIILVFGVLFTTFGRSLYISAKLGPGPRDGLFVGLTAITKIKVKYVKISIELIVLLIGVLLGGTAGVGTVLIILTSGYLVQFFFKVLKYDPHDSVEIKATT